MRQNLPKMSKMLIAFADDIVGVCLEPSDPSCVTDGVSTRASR